MLSSLTPYLLTAGAAIVALLGIIVKSRRDGARLERERQAAEDLRARDIADEAHGEVVALPPEAAREELRRWAR